MAFLLSFWRRLPVLVRAILGGAVMATLGVLPWSLLASWNLEYGKALPWAVIPAGIVLWVYWRFAKGVGWPHRGAAARNTLSRANELTTEVWGLAMIAGILGLIAVPLMQGIMSRLVHLPQQSANEFAGIPLFTTIILAIMGALVAGVVEEISFRGYMQGPIERRHGPVVAILVTGLLFGLAHFTHAEVTIALLPYYMLIAVNYGALAWLTNSILPSIVLHTGGNIFSALMLLGAGRSEWEGDIDREQWQAPAEREPLIWDTGLDTSFMISIVAFVGVAVAAVFAFRSLADMVKKTVR